MFFKLKKLRNFYEYFFFPGEGPYVCFWGDIFKSSIVFFVQDLFFHFVALIKMTVEQNISCLLVFTLNVSVILTRIFLRPN